MTLELIEMLVARVVQRVRQCFEVAGGLARDGAHAASLSKSRIAQGQYTRLPAGLE